ncbi:gas vesicle protein [Chthonomonas calidirosea]|uniref:YtxH domain-containing protein n=1 Tax=Chthonomonas calidirosea TaxID=454171 RepID=UPI0006DD40F7|nr:YtxH domain-containing protein [Chthonomonas calidirosea]CEK14651.1 gas vesicle protein [Chthonomonas calidirosea]CEK14652.1 gas vesicle protein [Chthonomonas calidirosea]
MSKDSNNWSGYVACFMLGAITGAAIALLFAPQEGAETRKQLAQKANELKSKASDKAVELKSKASDLKEKASDYSTEIAKTAKERWGSLVENVASSAQEVKQRIQSAVVKDGSSSTSAEAQPSLEAQEEA